MDIKGVQTTPPSTFSALKIQENVREFFKGAPSNTKVTALLRVDMKNGANLVIASKLNDNVFIHSWIGKDWEGPVEGGVEAVVYF